MSLKFFWQVDYRFSRNRGQSRSGLIIPPPPSSSGAKGKKQEQEEKGKENLNYRLLQRSQFHSFQKNDQTLLFLPSSCNSIDRRRCEQQQQQERLTRLSRDS